MKFRTLLALLLALALCLAPMSVLAAGEEAEAPVRPALGEPMPDFTFTACDGREYTLSEVLQEKDMVLLNLWGTWCPNCVEEFPFMEKAYEQYSDRVEIFAMTDYEDDTDEAVAAFAEDLGLTFPMGSDPIGMAEMFDVSGYPTSVVVDRNGVICGVEAGAIIYDEGFPMLFDQFVGDDYTEPNILTDGFPRLPPAEPTVEPTDPAELAEVLLGECAVEVTVINPEDQYNWPMVVSEDGESPCVTVSNTGADNSSSTLLLTFATEEDAAFAVDYKLSTEAGYDTMTIAPDDGPGKTLSGEWDWRTYACRLEPGEHIVALSFYKDDMEAGGEDAVWFDNFRVVTGDDVAEALAAMPQYPYADETTVTVTSEDARQIVFDDPDGVLEENFGAAQYFIVPEEYTVSATLSEDFDPESATITNSYDYSSDMMANCVDGDGYTFTATGVDSMAQTGYSYGYVAVESMQNEADFAVVVTFADEQNVNAFLDEMELDSWAYADGAEPSTDERAEASDGTDDGGMSDYMLAFTDENGEPVEGVIANVCDDETCEPMTSDADGLIEFTRPAFAYHIQIIKVPEGYEYDTGEETYLDEAGDVAFYTLTRAE